MVPGWQGCFALLLVFVAAGPAAAQLLNCSADGTTLRLPVGSGWIYGGTYAQSSNSYLDAVRVCQWTVGGNPGSSTSLSNITAAMDPTTSALLIFGASQAGPGAVICAYHVVTCELPHVLVLSQTASPRIRHRSC